MRKIVLKTVLCLSMFACLTNSAKAFVFSDVAALAQRVAKHLQDATQYVQTAHQWYEQNTQFMGYVQEFNNYKKQFQGYMDAYKNIYRKIESGYYTKNFDVSKWDWKNLDDHLLKAWKTVDLALWDAQKMTVRTSKLYESNPLYKRYADRVMQLGDDKIEKMKKDEALANDLEKRAKDRQAALEKFRATQEELATSDDNATHLQALQNQILLELAAMQAEAGVIERQRMRNAQEMENLSFELERLTSESQANEAESWQWIFETTWGK